MVDFNKAFESRRRFMIRFSKGCVYGVRTPTRIDRIKSPASDLQSQTKVTVHMKVNSHRLLSLHSVFPGDINIMLGI